jgi:uroporphyrin-III C-methyltransferase
MAQPFTLPGKVYLIDAGLVPTEQLTRRVQELLRRADLVLHEDLVSDDVTALISVHASVQDVRKPIDDQTISPEEIQGRMIAAARNGQVVVRLKGEEPSSFGQMDEEMAALTDARIEFESIPGAAVAASATGHVPPMERESASKHVS